MCNPTSNADFLQAIDAILASDLPAPAKLIAIARQRTPGITVAQLEVLTGVCSRSVYRYKRAVAEWQNALAPRADSGVSPLTPVSVPPDTRVSPTDTRVTPPLTPESPPPDSGVSKQRSEIPPIYPPITTSTDRSSLVDGFQKRNNFWANLNPDYNQTSQVVWWDDLGRLQVANGFRAELITTLGGEANLRPALDEAAAYVETRFVGLDLLKRVRGRIAQQLRWKAEAARKTSRPEDETPEQRAARYRKIFEEGEARDAARTRQ